MTATQQATDGNGRKSPEPVGPQSGPVQTAPSRSGRARKIAIVVVALAAGGGLAYWLHARNFEETDDAQIDGEISNIGARVAGTVQAVYVKESQLVKPGDLLLELDKADLEVQVAQAKAQVDQAAAQLAAEDPTVAITETSRTASIASASSDVSSAVANLSAAKQQVAQIAADLERARATDRQAQQDKERNEALIKSNSISQAEYDRTANAAAATAAGVRSLEEGLAAAQDRVREAQARVNAAQTRLNEVRTNAPMEVTSQRASVLVRKASLELAQAGLRQAELNLSYARVVAPIAGVVGKKSVAVGDHVAPGQQLLAITQIGHPWVTANFRETQLERVRPGQPVKVHVDALDQDFTGSVEAIGGATGARLSLFPPENATGNYVKVVQRIPVRIRLDPDQPGFERLRPGMSVEPEVRVR
jgi:membrane fusion protein (multidrug efflux system)